jgi:hypothetical protein
MAFSKRFKILAANGLYWTIFIGFVALFFYVGYYFGNNRFDSEKLTMRDTINVLKSQVKFQQTLNRKLLK